MNKPNEYHCRWCGKALEVRREGQKFCCPDHRYEFHKAQRITPGKLEEKVRAIVREELKATGLLTEERLDNRLPGLTADKAQPESGC